MRCTASAALLFLLSSAAAAQQTTAQQTTSQHSTAQSAKAAAPPAVKWGPAPAVFPAGAEMAVMAGDPMGSGEFTVRLRMPNGYRIAPHTHPTDENVTVISGNFRVGMGTTASAKGGMLLHAGGFVTAPANQAHWAMARGTTVVQVNGMGPFQLTYVNPADAPKTAAGGR